MPTNVVWTFNLPSDKFINDLYFSGIIKVSPSVANKELTSVDAYMFFTLAFGNLFLISDCNSKVEPSPPNDICFTFR